MKKVICWLMFVMTFVVGALNAETKQREFTVKAGQLLRTDIKSGGSITVTGWDREQVTVTVKMEEGDEAFWGLEMKSTSAGVEVATRSVHGHHNSPEFVFQVPQHFNLQLDTMGGNLELKNIAGEIKGKTMGGKLDLTGLKGKLEIESMGGDITLKDSEVDGYAKTMGGKVQFENVTGDVKGSSMGGLVTYKNVRGKKGDGANKVVKISTMGGDINVADAPDGADVDTMGGNIQIKSAGKFVKAKTMGGNIKLQEVNGSVQATTMGGDVETYISGDITQGDKNIDLSSMGGTITLSVPEKLDMTIEIELEYTKNGHQDYSIKSDFPLQIETSKEWDNSHGTPRKTITGKGKTGSGKNTIKIKTINGNVYLKKHQ